MSPASDPSAGHPPNPQAAASVPARIPELAKKPDVCYAVTDDGIELPVIDVSHPAFASDVGEAALRRAIAETLDAAHRFKVMSPVEMRDLAQCSILLRNGLKAKGGALSAMATYLNKLGPANLGSGYASDWDRRAAGQLLPLVFRHRLATIAHLIADSLIPALAATPGPVHLFNRR